MQASASDFLKITQKQIDHSPPKSNIIHSQPNNPAFLEKAIWKYQKTRQKKGNGHLSSPHFNKESLKIKEKPQAYIKPSRYELYDPPFQNGSKKEKRRKQDKQESQNERKINRIFSRRKNLPSDLKKQRKKGSRQKITIRQHQALQSFLCRSIEPTTARPITTHKYFRPSQQPLSRSPRADSFLDRKILPQQNSRVCYSVIGGPKPFQSRLKKKSLQSSPHLLATMIRHKYETMERDELYAYVQRIISKCAKH